MPQSLHTLNFYLSGIVEIHPLISKLHFLCWLWLTAKEIKKNLHGLFGCNCKIDIPAMVLLHLECLNLICRAACQPNCTNRDFFRSAGRPGKTCSGNCKISGKSTASSLNHRNRNFLANSRFLFKKLVRNTE